MLRSVAICMLTAINVRGLSKRRVQGSHLSTAAYHLLLPDEFSFAAASRAPSTAADAATCMCTLDCTAWPVVCRPWSSNILNSAGRAHSPASNPDMQAGVVFVSVTPSSLRT